MTIPARRRMITVGLSIEALIEGYAARRGVSFSMALHMIVLEWQTGDRVLMPPDLPGEKLAIEKQMEAFLREALRKKII